MDKRRNNFQNGITLIALVISIIVMLILAGVSLNATIGDNGIITQAQNATYMQSIAALEEYLQTEYVKYYDETENYTSKIELLSSKLGNLCLKDGTKNYITYDGKMYYLINKQALPDDVKNQLKGGDTTEYLKYIRLQDVYGVTPDLKVYYCESGTDSALGTLDSTKLDPKIPLKKINQDAEMKSAITEALASVGVTVGEDGVTVGDASKIKNLELDGSKHNITSISGLSELSSLKTVTLSNLNLNDLDGLQNCTLLYYVYFKNCKVNDYSKLATVLDLQYLYLYLPPSMSEADANAQVTNLGNGLANATELNKVEYFGISGTTDMMDGNYHYGINSTKDKYTYYSKSKSQLTDIQGLDKLPDNIKKNIKYMSLNNNNFNDISVLQTFTKIYSLDIMGNYNLTNLTGLEEHSMVYLTAQNCNFDNIKGLSGNSKLKYVSLKGNLHLTSLNGLNDSIDLALLIAYSCDLSDITALNNHTKLNYLDLSTNVNLKNVLTLGTCIGIKQLYLSDNINMIGTEVRDALANSNTHILENCGANYSIPSKYNLYFSTLTYYDYSNLGLTDESDEINSLKNKTKVTSLNLSGNPNLSNDKLQEILSTMTGLKALSLNGCRNLAAIDFVGQGKVTKLIELDLRNTKSELIDLSNLNDYGTKLQTLIINNSNIDMSKIQITINRLSNASLDYIEECISGKYYWQARGILIDGNLSNYSFKNCNEITKIATYETILDNGNDNISGKLDLTMCNNLTEYYSYTNKMNVKLPSSLEKFSGRKNLVADLSLCNKLKYYYRLSPYQNAMINDFKTLNSSAKLEKIELYKDGLSDFSFLNFIDTSNLIEIIVFGNGSDYQPSTIKNLDGIENALNLTTLTIDGSNDFIDTSAISKCTNLNSITISDCPNLEKVSGLQDLSKVTTLNLYNCKIGRIEGINNLVNVETLNLSNNKISDISFLKNMKKLSDSIYLNGNNISDISSLEGTLLNGKISYNYLNLNDNIIQTTSINGNNNVETLKKLYSAGLRNLEISGNNFTAGTTDELKNLKWNYYKE